MANLSQVIDYTQLFQDVELATAIGQLKQDPIQLQQFLQGQQGKVYEDVIKQKDSTFQKVYGDLNRASQAQGAILMLDKRNQELMEITEQITNNQQSRVNNITENKNLSGRKYEMNQWSVNNKKDTLFVFSSLFILLSTLTLLVVLWRINLLGGGAVGILSALFIIIFISIVIYRSNITDIWRDNRYWNRMHFSGRYGKIPVPLCPDITNNIKSFESNIQVEIDNTTKKINSMS